MEIYTNKFFSHIISDGLRSVDEKISLHVSGELLCVDNIECISDVIYNLIKTGRVDLDTIYSRCINMYREDPKRSEKLGVLSIALDGVEKIINQEQ